MPELSCTVQTCVHNYQYLCELDKIQVEETVRRMHRRPVAIALKKEEREVIATRRIR